MDVFLYKTACTRHVYCKASQAYTSLKQLQACDKPFTTCSQACCKLALKLASLCKASLIFNLFKLVNHKDRTVPNIK